MHDFEFPVAVIGAGPYGLSIAAHLKALQIPFRIFGEPMSSWVEHMPRGMLLKSEGFASSLYDATGQFSLCSYCQEIGVPYRAIGEPVPLERFVSYGLEFQRRFVPQLERKQVLRLGRRGSNFELTTSTGETVRVRCVIVATGITHFGYLPPELENQSPELVSHSSAHTDLSRFTGTRVAVIGAGSSAIDTAALLHEAGVKVHVVARRDSIDFHDRTMEPRPLLERLRAPWSGLGVGWRSRLCTDAPVLFHAMPERFRLMVVRRHLGPAPGWFMKDRVLGRFPIHLGASVLGIQANRGRALLRIERKLAGTQDLEVDHVIAATGYRPAISRLPFLDPGLLDEIRTVDAAPALNRFFESSVQGLYFVGLASANSFGPLVRFAFGARFTARRLTRHLARVLRFDISLSMVPKPSDTT